MNLGDHVGDEPDRVLANRRVLKHMVGRRPVFLQQVHGVGVLKLESETPDGATADACFTDQLDVACAIMVADCLPVLMCDVEGRWVAAAHAGWRGLAGEDGLGVLESLLSAVQPVEVSAKNILVWLGPCIGPQAFEVGSDVRTIFSANDPEASAMFVPQSGGKFLANLAGLARLRLQRMGVTQIFGNDGQAQWCTASQPSKFFSHRRDSSLLGQTGRMAACIWLDG